jgi:hypothetical protein
MDSHDKSGVEQRERQLRDLNHINNTLANKIMIKRDQLRSKLSTLEEMNKVYNHEMAAHLNTPSAVTPTSGFDFIAEYDKNVAIEANTANARYKGKDKQLSRMDEIVLSLESNQAERAVHQEFEQLQSEAQSKHANNLTFHLMKLNYGLAAKDASYTVSTFEDLVKCANSIDSTGHMQNMIPANMAT